MSKTDWSVVWITGASTGIGAALALELARGGCTVAISARGTAALEDLAHQAKGLAGELWPYPLDVTDAAACVATLEQIEAERGAVTLAVLNAGSHRALTLNEFEVAAFESLMRLNYMGVVNVALPLLERMRRRRSGQMAITASLAGYRGLPTASAYGASKAALINFAEALEFDLKGTGIALSLINPGFVRTPLTDRNTFPMPFLLEPDDAAQRIIRGLRQRRFEIAFPWRFVFALKLFRLLPYWLYFPLVRRITRS
ncbi:SDR family NAD(P)-dependent oxidoreductase [Marinobacterium sedimentorum]|uniref:SDR family NAD(P)-dependent oxidoreductase n=1 Tax=Marinobacterium sedimentorum TaxID=2927804 RepID=UPI0020C6A564|nr:SDR family NAD(P)-dependent oxidoreductase [Marinobacterium sedimentorum]MCP8688605.1 SDR family NAD(P)-dependent oxidoreductase [Marinobacterium sedimentorum]